MASGAFKLLISTHVVLLCSLNHRYSTIISMVEYVSPIKAETIGSLGNAY